MPLPLTFAYHRCLQLVNGSVHVEHKSRHGSGGRVRETHERAFAEPRLGAVQEYWMKMLEVATRLVKCVPLEPGKMFPIKPTVLDKIRAQLASIFEVRHTQHVSRPRCSGHYPTRA